MTSVVKYIYTDSHKFLPSLTLDPDSDLYYPISIYMRHPKQGTSSHSIVGRKYVVTNITWRISLTGVSQYQQYYRIDFVRLKFDSLTPTSDDLEECYTLKEDRYEYAPQSGTMINSLAHARQQLDNPNIQVLKTVIVKPMDMELQDNQSWNQYTYFNHTGEYSFNMNDVNLSHQFSADYNYGTYSYGVLVFPYRQSNGNTTPPVLLASGTMTYVG